MRVLLCSAIAATCALFAGCESELPPNRDTQGRFQRGFSGQGSLVQPDHSDDPIIRESSRHGH
jgi:hypothetical protein